MAQQKELSAPVEALSVPLGLWEKWEETQYKYVFTIIQVISWQVLTFIFSFLTQKSALSTAFIYKTGSLIKFLAYLKGINDIRFLCESVIAHRPSQHHKTDFNISSHITQGKHNKAKQHKGWKLIVKETWIGRKGVLVSCLCL